MLKDSTPSEQHASLLMWGEGGLVFANVNAPRPKCVRGRLLPLLGVPEKQAWKITGVPGSAPRNKFVDESMIHSFRTMMFHIIDGCGQ